MDKERANLVHILQHCSLAAGMDEDMVGELLDSSQVRQRTYEKGSIIFHDGETPRSLYILLSGEVHILKDTFSGRQIFLSAIDEPGDMFGEVYEVLKQPYDMYVQAARTAQVLELSSRLFSLDAGGQITRSALMVQRNLMRIFARKAYFMHNKIKVMASGSLREKIVRFLFQNMDRSAETKLPFSREFLAAYLAVTRPSLSRELSAMQRDGILRVEGRTIQVADRDRFEEYL